MKICANRQQLSQLLTWSTARSLLTTLTGVLAEHGPAAGFQASCPGGEAPALATTASRVACQHALATATRQGILLTLLVYGWASIHYLLGAIGLDRALREATARNAQLSGAT